ncbi:hypothetical protein FA95DRAFT_966778 [Auriscalpium vulgare]|uniref:Uncharacterized protein n=1 Tax=Auriscalpium vulgare TaxID=40419 RepID=A0ACB8R8K9_9AGAM|nr:hypothetical protein FA95DRAFT_966778 [Auriscalpium vulgare]
MAEGDAVMKGQYLLVSDDVSAFTCLTTRAGSCACPGRRMDRHSMRLNVVAQQQIELQTSVPIPGVHAYGRSIAHGLGRPIPVVDFVPGLGSWTCGTTPGGAMLDLRAHEAALHTVGLAVHG